MKKLIVTGGSGMVGQNLIPLLIKNNYKVVSLDKNKNNLELLKRLNPKIRAVNVNLVKKDKWFGEFRNAYAVIDLKAQIASKNKQEFQRNNVKTEKNIIEACEKYAVQHLIHASSSVVISVAKDDYTKTKRKCENIVHNSKVPHTILRPTLMYGCFDVKHLDFIGSLMDKLPIIPIPGSGKYIRQPVSALDFCKIILSCLKRPAENSIHNIIGFEKIYFIDLLKIIAKTKKLKRLVVGIPLPLFRFLLKIHTFILRKPTVTPDQLKALMGGDIFPEEDWPTEFDVKYTPFKKGIKQVYSSKQYKYKKDMNSPH